jgi:hypothetical protein
MPNPQQVDDDASAPLTREQLDRQQIDLMIANVGQQLQTFRSVAQSLTLAVQALQVAFARTGIDTSALDDRAAAASSSPKRFGGK